MAFSSAEIFESYAMDASVVPVPTAMRLDLYRVGSKVILRVGRGSRPVAWTKKETQHKRRTTDEYRAKMRARYAARKAKP